MKSLKKSISLFIATNIAIITLWALPGFQSFLPDQPGEYVYYEDTTFSRKSYFGILYYSEEAIQVRYYAPADKNKKLPENEVSILISIDPDEKYWKMTGERILSTITPNTDDVTIVNYLHDMLYEFSAHRIRITDLNEQNIEIMQDFSQFGGKVVINYDCTIPLFNIKNIDSAEGNPLLKCVTVGQLLKTGDNSFNNFKGFPEEKYKKTRKHYKKAEPLDYKFENQSIIIDDNCEPIMDNLWSLNDDAFLSMATLPPVFKDDKRKTELFLIKNFAKSKETSYLNYETLKIESNYEESEYSKDNYEIKLTIQVETYNQSNGKTAVNTILISDIDSDSLNSNLGNMNFLSLAVFKQPWINNKKYYTEILDSHKN